MSGGLSESHFPVSEQAGKERNEGEERPESIDENSSTESEQCWNL